MNKYERGKIYKIVDDSNGNIYIGSTIQKYISTRLQGHVCGYKRYLKGLGCNVRSFEIIKNNNYHIELIELYPCKNSISLRTRERHFIETLKCVNKNIPSRTKKEWKIDNRKRVCELQKGYAERHKEQERQRYQKYYKDNKEWTSIRDKPVRSLYREKNRDILNEKHKEYKLKNKDKIKAYNDFKDSWCGSFARNNNNCLLRISMDLFD